MTTIRGEGLVEFRFFRPGVSQVFLAGTFNRWQPAIPLESKGDGWWIATVTLPPGEYQFRYLADGQWFTDYAAQGIEPFKGSWNSILVVPGECTEEVQFAAR